MKKIKIAFGSDHAGYNAKQVVIPFLKSRGYTVIDVGTHSEESVDYPDYAMAVAKAVISKKADRGMLFCGTGIGMCIAANKIKGIRAALAWKPEVAALAAQHNWSNVLCLPSRFTSIGNLKKIALTWLETPYELGGRHERRIGKISKFERKS